jgi:hypothetical protein
MDSRLHSPTSDLILYKPRTRRAAHWQMSLQVFSNYHRSSIKQSLMVITMGYFVDISITIVTIGNHMALYIHQQRKLQLEALPATTRFWYRILHQRSIYHF